ncbi:MAG: hypothetical protein LBR92_01665 [Puniceicoccales bacterium]|jgi:hypothetical protein|nr:hypothetical protein [Puniceicoccales bacterium]
MIEDGYTEKFANEVSSAIIILYQNTIDDLLPSDIGSVSDVVFAPEYITMRINVTNKLKQIMEDYDADYNIINRYLKGQQQNSWSEESLAMKYFLFTQRQDSNDFEKVYFWGGQKLSTLELKYVQDLVKNIQNRSNDNGLILNIKKEKYARSVAFYKALTAIALNKVQVPERINHENNTCILQRGMKREDLIKFYPEYAKINEGEIFTDTMKHGIADSAALGASAPIFTNPKEYDVLEIETPFSRIFAVYFISPELSFDGPPYGLPIRKNSKDNKQHRGSEHEFVCDMSNLPIKIKKMSDIEYSPTPSYSKERLKANGYKFRSRIFH